MSLPNEHVTTVRLDDAEWTSTIRRMERDLVQLGSRATQAVGAMAALDAIGGDTQLNAQLAQTARQWQTTPAAVSMQRRFAAATGVEAGDIQAGVDRIREMETWAPGEFGQLAQQSGVPLDLFERMGIEMGGAEGQQRGYLATVEGLAGIEDTRQRRQAAEQIFGGGQTTQTALTLAELGPEQLYRSREAARQATTDQFGWGQRDTVVATEDELARRSAVEGVAQGDRGAVRASGIKTPFLELGRAAVLGGLGGLVGDESVTEGIGRRSVEALQQQAPSRRAAAAADEGVAAFYRGAPAGQWYEFLESMATGISRIAEAYED